MNFYPFVKTIIPRCSKILQDVPEFQTLLFPWKSFNLPSPIAIFILLHNCHIKYRLVLNRVMVLVKSRWVFRPAILAWEKLDVNTYYYQFVDESSLFSLRMVLCLIYFCKLRCTLFKHTF